MQAIRPVGAGISDFPSLSPLLNELRDAVLELQSPPGPVQLASVLFAALPDAALWTGCILYVSDKAKVGLSNGTTWTDTAGGAL